MAPDSLAGCLKGPPESFSHRSDPQRTARVRIGPSRAAALLDGLFEHPAEKLSPCPYSSAVMPKWFFRSPLRCCALLLNRLEVLDHPIPYETVQPEIRGTFYFDKFNSSQITMHPPHVGFIDR